MFPHQPYCEQQGKVEVHVNFCGPPHVPLGSTFAEEDGGGCAVEGGGVEGLEGVAGEGFPPKAKAA